MSKAFGVTDENIEELEMLKVALQDDIRSLRGEKASLVSIIQKLKAEAEALGQHLGATIADEASLDGKSEFAESPSPTRRVSTYGEAMKQASTACTASKAGNHPGRQWGSSASSPPLDSWSLSIDDTSCPLLEIEPRNISGGNEQVAAAFLAGDIMGYSPSGTITGGIDKADSPDKDQQSTPTKQIHADMNSAVGEKSNNGNRNVVTPGDNILRENLEHDVVGRHYAKKPVDSKQYRSKSSGLEATQLVPLLEEKCLDEVSDCPQRKAAGKAKDCGGGIEEMCSPDPRGRKELQQRSTDDQEDQITNSFGGVDSVGALEPVRFDETVKGRGAKTKRSAAKSSDKMSNRVSSPDRIEPQHQQLSEQHESNAANPSSVDLVDGSAQQNNSTHPSTAVSPKNEKKPSGGVGKGTTALSASSTTENSRKMIVHTRNHPACTTTPYAVGHEQSGKKNQVQQKRAGGVPPRQRTDMKARKKLRRSIKLTTRKTSKSLATTNGNRAVAASNNIVSEQEKEIRRQKERFLMFTRVLMKYLETKDPLLHKNVKAIIKECAERNKRQEPGYESVTASMRKRLKQVVEEAYWKRAEAYLAHFLLQKQKRSLSSPLPENTGNLSLRSSPPVDAREIDNATVTQNGIQNSIADEDPDGAEVNAKPSSGLESNETDTDSCASDSEDEEEHQCELASFLKFVEVLAKCLDSEDLMSGQQVRDIVKDCTEKNTLREPGYESLEATLREQLKSVVEFSHWAHAERLYATHSQTRPETSDDDDDDDAGSTDGSHPPAAPAPERQTTAPTDPKTLSRPIAARRTPSGSKQIISLISSGKRRLLGVQKAGAKRSKRCDGGVAS